MPVRGLEGSDEEGARGGLRGGNRGLSGPCCRPCSGTAIMQDGNTMRNNYGCDLDALGTGARIGMMRTAKGDLHYFIDGQDQGAACSGLPPGKGDCSLAFGLPASRQPSPGRPASDALLLHTEVYAVVDLYGQCVQVSITSATGPMDNSLATSNTATEKSFPLHSPGSAGPCLCAVGLRDAVSPGGAGDSCSRTRPPRQLQTEGREQARVRSPREWGRGLPCRRTRTPEAGHVGFGSGSGCGERRRRSDGKMGL